MLYMFVLFRGESNLEVRFQLVSDYPRRQVEVEESRAGWMAAIGKPRTSVTWATGY